MRRNPPPVDEFKIRRVEFQPGEIRIRVTNPQRDDLTIASVTVARSARSCAQAASSPTSTPWLTPRRRSTEADRPPGRRGFGSWHEQKTY